MRRVTYEGENDDDDVVGEREKWAIYEKWYVCVFAGQTFEPLIYTGCFFLT